MEEAMRKVWVGVFFRGCNAVDLSDVASGEFFDAAAVSIRKIFFWAVLLSERDLGS
jgi:hypothetical protein